MSSSPENTFDAGPYSRVPHVLRWAGRGPHWLRNRAFALAAVAWVPLAVFSAAQGLALSDQRRESQLLDISAYVRYLVAIPTFVLAEAICLPQLGKIVRQFLDAGLVTGDERGGYETILDSTRTLLTSPEVELALLAIAYISTLATSESLYPEAVSTWVSPIREGSRTLSLAGWWLMLVSQPLYQVLIAIWLWRVVVWARLLWKLSRLNLQLLPSIRTAPADWPSWGPLSGASRRSPSASARPSLPARPRRSSSMAGRCRSSSWWSGHWSSAWWCCSRGRSSSLLRLCAGRAFAGSSPTGSWPARWVGDSRTGGSVGTAR